MRLKILVPALLGVLLALGGGWAVSQAPEPPPQGQSGTASPPPEGAQQGAPAPRPEPKAEVVDSSRVPTLLLGARQEILLYTDRFSYAPLAQALREAVVQRGVRVRLLLPAEAFSAQDSFAMGFAFLSLKRPNLEVKVLAGGKVDPRAVVDRSYLLVGYPLEGLPPEVRGPLLLFRDPATVGLEAERFARYWASAPYCRPRARYEAGRLRTWCDLSNTRP